jgi:hypothetical protein
MVAAFSEYDHVRDFPQRVRMAENDSLSKGVFFCFAVGEIHLEVIEDNFPLGRSSRS